MMGIAKVPAVYPALGADGIYSSARDMARFVQLHINQGMLDGHAFVQRSLVDTISIPVGIAQTGPERVLWPRRLYRQAVAWEDRDCALARWFGIRFHVTDVLVPGVRYRDGRC